MRKRMKMLIAALIVLTSLITISHATCAEVRVGADCLMRWQAPTENANGTPLTDLKEYRVYIRDVSGVYPAQPAGPAILAPTTQASCQAMGITVDGHYAAVVKAVDTSGFQSVASNEVVFVRDTAGPGAPQMFDVVIQMQGILQLSPR